MAEKKMLELQNPPQKEGKGDSKAIVPSSNNMAEMAELLGVPFDVERYIETLKNSTVKIAHGEISRLDYIYLLIATLQEFKIGAVDHQVAKLIQQQNASRVKSGKVRPLSAEEIRKRTMFILLRMAEMKIKYGLSPITDVIPMSEGTQVYVTEAGYRKYAFASGELEKIEIKEPVVTEITHNGKKGTRASVTVIAKRKGLPEMSFTRTASDVYGQSDFTHNDVTQMAQTRAVRTALKFLFPLGLSEEEREGVEEAFSERIEAVEALEASQGDVEVRKILTGEEVDSGD